VPFANVPLAPLPDADAVKVTTAPLTGLPPASLTVACSAVGYAVLIAMLCGVPAVAVMLAGAPVRLVNKKLAVPVTPATLAVTVYGPAVMLAVNVEAVAWPELLVVAVVVAVPFANVPLAPLLDAGAAKVTVAPLTGLPAVSCTVTSSKAKLVLIATLCGVPAIAVMLDAGPARLVSAKLAVPVTPGTVALTV
jgi:hypothetical protein